MVTKFLSLKAGGYNWGEPERLAHVSFVSSTMCEKLQIKIDNSPCHGKINSVDYSTSLFVLCRQPCHGEMCTSLSVSCRQPCHGEIYGVDYYTSLFVSCRQPCHGEMHGVDNNTSLFVSCRQPCHSEMYGVDYSTSLFVRVINHAMVK